MEGLQGSGLGLKIIKDIVETRKGNIGLVDAPPGYTTCFRIEIPVATGKERKDHGY
jgi:signal transduction histidine kinase